MTKKALKNIAIKSSQKTSDAFAIILLHYLKTLTVWQAEARSWDNIEGVHQTRVALRRMRSIIRLFRPAVPSAAGQVWMDEMRWIAGELGDARDLDVLMTQTLDAVAERLPLPGREKLTLLAQWHRERAYENVNLMLDDRRYADFKKKFRAFLKTREWLHGELSPQQQDKLRQPIGQFAAERLEKLDRRLRRRARRTDPEDAPALHELRIECKNLRYAADAFYPLFVDMNVFISHLKSLQDLLGILNDVDVTRHLLAQMLAGKRDRELFFYAGGIIGWRARQYEEVHDTFKQRWRKFKQAERPWQSAA